MPAVLDDPFEMTATGGVAEARSADLAEARRAAMILFEPFGSHEIRALPFGRSRLVREGDDDALVAALDEFADAAGVYYTLNPVRPELGDRGAKNADVTARRWLLVDVDPVKAEKDASATAVEKGEADRVARVILADLAAAGWPAPVVVDSGNGAHLLYRVELPNDPLAKQYLAGCLKALAGRYSGPTATVDKAVHNAARIAKLPGTWARKGPDSPNRPHRLARLTFVPESIDVVPVERLRELAGIGDDLSAIKADPKAWTAGTADPFEMVASGGANGSMAAYLRAAIENEAAKVALAPEGDRNNTLNAAAFKLGTLLGQPGVDRGELERLLALAAGRAGLHGDEVAATVRSGLDAGAQQPRTMPNPADRKSGKKGAAPPIAEGRPLTVRASSIVPKRVDWLWQDRLPKHFITVFAGRTGLGKSFVTCDIAARVSQGDELPEGNGECFAAGNVLFISEDPYDYVLAPRLIEMGADLGRISFLTWEAMANYSLGDIEFLERAYQEAGQPTLIAIDPPTNFLGGRDEHKNAEIRQLLMGLVIWLANRPAAVVLITHVNKSTGKGVEALNRVMGSVAWTTTSRIAHSFSPDPDDESRCLFVPMKSNLGQKARGLSYRIVKTDTLARVEWLGQVDTSADDALSGDRPATAKPKRADAARDWLIARFREQREWPSEMLLEKARQEGLSRNAVWEAKADLSLGKPKKEHDHWVWWVPPDWRHLCPV